MVYLPLSQEQSYNHHAIKFHKDLYPMFRKINDTDDNSYHLLSSYHVPGPMLRPVHALVTLILTTVPWWINNAH